jgi:hypothetical protein
MLPVRLAVHDVVDEVNDAGEYAEHGEGRDGEQNRGRIRQPPREQECGEDDQVLGPL